MVNGEWKLFPSRRYLCVMRWAVNHGGTEGAETARRVQLSVPSPCPLCLRGELQHTLHSRTDRTCLSHSAPTFHLPNSVCAPAAGGLRGRAFRRRGGRRVED